MPLLPITTLSPNQSANGSFTIVNTNFATVDAGFANIVDRTLSAPPGSPAVNAAYIPAGTPTGAWAGKVNKIAVWDGGAWQFYTPFTGQVKFVISEAYLRIVWSGSAWTTITVDPAEITSLPSSKISDFDESVDDRVASLLVAGTNISLSYNDAGNALTISASGAFSGSYLDLTDKPTLGTAAALDVGTTANKVVQLNGSGQLPAVDGSLLTNVGGSQGTLKTATLTTSTLADQAREDTVISMQINPFSIVRIQSDFGARINMFLSTAYQTASAGAAFTLDGFDDLFRTGVIVDVQETSAIDVWCAIMAHGIVGNSANIPVSITNRSSASRAITITITYFG
jgi:hypothetical protein